jgi:hypothetical protein
VAEFSTFEVRPRSCPELLSLSKEYVVQLCVFPFHGTVVSVRGVRSFISRFSWDSCFRARREGSTSCAGDPDAEATRAARARE